MVLPLQTCRLQPFHPSEGRVFSPYDPKRSFGVFTSLLQGKASTTSPSAEALVQTVLGETETFVHGFTGNRVTNSMRLKLISCEVFKREFERLLKSNGNGVEVSYQPFGLHNTPKELNKELQKGIDECPSGRFDAILLAYGICSNAVIGLKASHTPVVVPRSHDCIGVLLGSRQRYVTEFRKAPGTYWFSSGWIDNQKRNGEWQLEQSGAESLREADRKQHYEDYVRRYGESNAQYLMEEEAKWKQHYSRLVYIHRDLRDGERYRKHSQELAGKEGWKFEEILGDDRFLASLLSGEWADQDFLVVRPGQQVVATWDERLIVAEATL